MEGNQTTVRDTIKKSYLGLRLRAEHLPPIPVFRRTTKQVNLFHPLAGKLVNQWEIGPFSPQGMHACVQRWPEAGFPRVASYQPLQRMIVFKESAVEYMASCCPASHTPKKKGPAPLFGVLDSRCLTGSALLDCHVLKGFDIYMVGILDSLSDVV